MVVHHAQAVVMVDLARDHLTDPQVKALASRIADEQEPEIAYMAKLLRERRADVPPQAENPHFAANSHGGHGSMPELSIDPVVAGCGEDEVIYPGPTFLGSEDFAFMLQEKKGTYCFIGNGDTPMVHHPQFVLNQNILPKGAAYWVALTEGYLR